MAEGWNLGRVGSLILSREDSPFPQPLLSTWEAEMMEEGLHRAPESDPPPNSLRPNLDTDDPEELEDQKGEEGGGVY